MSSMIQSPSDVTASKIEFGPVKLLDSGGKSVNIRYEGRNLMLETPSLSVPYGVSVFDKQGPPKFSLDLSLRGADENEQVGAFKNFLEEFDERMVDAGVENAGKWFKMNNPNRDVIKAFYTPLVKISRNPDGTPKDYPPTFKLSLRKKIAKKGEAADPSKEIRAFETDFYDGTTKSEGGQITAFDRTQTVDDVLPKRSQCTVIIQCTGVWFAGGKFGTTWKAVQLRVDNQPEQIRGPAFKSDAPDVRAFLSNKLAAQAAEAGGDDSEEDEGSEEESAAAAVVAAAAPKKTFGKAAPAPAPTPVATFEEENVVEAVPAPKKTFNKKPGAAKK
jgi:hypothetical protein